MFTKVGCLYPDKKKREKFKWRNYNKDRCSVSISGK